MSCLCISVVSGSKGSSDELQTIHSQLATLTKTVEGYKTGSNGLDKISHNISTIFKQVRHPHIFSWGWAYDELQFPFCFRYCTNIQYLLAKVTVFYLSGNFRT